MGKWYKQPRKPVDTHKHEQPEYVTNDNDVQEGDRYQCSCGQVFEITGVFGVYAYGSENGMQGLCWKRIYAHGVERDTRLDYMKYDRDSRGPSALAGGR